jgi:hypothetical protein
MASAGREKVSRLSMNQRARSSSRRVCDAMAAMRCRACSEVFYVKHYEEHWCFKSQMDMIKNTEIERIKRARSDRTDGVREAIEEYEDVVLTPGEISIFNDRQALEDLLDIKPVMAKIWRAPSIYHRVFGKRSPGVEERRPGHPRI